MSLLEEIKSLFEKLPNDFGLDPNIIVDDDSVMWNTMKCLTECSMGNIIKMPDTILKQ